MILDIISSYEAVLIDAYGVLVDAKGPLPNAKAFVEELVTTNTNFLIVTNDASRSHEEIAQRFLSMDMKIQPDRILCSGSLIVDYFKAHELQGAKTQIMGTQASVDFAKTAGANVVDVQDGEFDVFIIADEAGYRFRESVDLAVTQIIRLIDQGKTPDLILPNPDLIYPSTTDSYGITAGSIATMIEAILIQRYGPDSSHKFSRLGKPETWIFESAFRHVGTRQAIMIGDQIHTDILGAQKSRIDSVLMLTGLTKSVPDDSDAIQPTYTLKSLNETPRSPQR